MGGAKAFPKDSELACGVAGRVASCVAGCWAPTLAKREGRTKRMLQVVIAVQFGSKQSAIAAISPGYFPWARVQQILYMYQPGRNDCLEITGGRRSSRIRFTFARLRVALLQALAWYRTPHSQRRSCTASASNAVRRCVRKKGRACGEVPWRADTVGQSAARRTESASRVLSLAAWEVAVRHGEVAIGAWAGPMYVCSKYVPGMPRYMQR